MCFTTTSNAAGTLNFVTKEASLDVPFFKTEMTGLSSVLQEIEVVGFINTPEEIDYAKYVYNVLLGKWVDPTEPLFSTPISSIPTDYMDCKYIVYTHIISSPDIDGTETVTWESKHLEPVTTTEEAYAKGGILSKVAVGGVQIAAYLTAEKFKEMVAEISGTPVDTDTPAVASPATGDASDFILYGFTLLGSIVLASTVIKRKELN